VVDDLTWPPLAYRHLERIQHELGAQMIGHGPTDDPTAEGIEHHSEVEEARGGGHEGDVGDPELVWRLGREVAVHQVRCRAGFLIAPRRHRATAPVAGSGKAGLAHQARDALAAVPFAQAAQQGVDAW
jgi:hypothetical protein